MTARAEQGRSALSLTLATGKGITQLTDAGASPETHIVGLVVDGREVDTLEIIFIGDSHHLPLEPIAKHIDATVSVDATDLTFETPGGTATIPGSRLTHWQGTVYISGEVLHDYLATDSRFDPSQYAIVLDLPWWRTGAKRTAKDAPAPTPDAVPPRASLSQMRVDYWYTSFDETDRHVLDYRLDGALLDGGWRVDVNQDLDQDTYLSEYHWVQARDHSQLLVGRQDATLHPLFPSAEFTGGQVFLSNRELDPVLGYTITRSDFARTLARPQQDIRGVAKPGSVAELRVEGRIVARQRVRLDGSYEFLGVTFPSRGFSQVEVFVRDGRAGTLLEIQDHSRSASQLMLDAGHRVATFGAGAAGNVLDRDDSRSGGVGIAQWRAGLTDTLTVEAAYQGADGVNTAQLGVVEGLGRNWVTTLGAVADEGGAGGMAELFGYGDRWNLEYLGRETGAGYRGTESASLHDASYRYYASRELTLGGRARYSDGVEGGETFILPGASWAPTPRTWLRVWPNVDGDYRVDADFRPTPFSQARYSYENDEHRLYLSRFARSGIEYYFEVRDRQGFDARFESGARWSLDNDDRSRFELAAISTESGDVGYYGRAEKTLLPGVYASFEIRDDPLLHQDLVDDYDPGLTVQLRLTLDYSLANGRPVPASMAARDTTSGAIAGRFRIKGDLPPPPDLEKVTLLIDGRPRTVPSTDGRFHVGGLKPGLHRVRLDHQSLPIELVPTGETLWVKVAHAAVTKVDFWTQLEFGVAGRVARDDGTFAVGSKLWILDQEGNVRVSTYTDQWGLYRADGLPPGTYRLEVVGDDGESIGAATEFTIADDFLFGVDLTLTDPLAL